MRNNSGVQFSRNI